MFAETRKLVIDAQFQKERADLERELSQWRPKGGSSMVKSMTEGEGGGGDSEDGEGAADGGGGGGIGQSKSQSWLSKRLTSGAPLFETEAYKRRSMAMLDPIIVDGNRRRSNLNAMIDFIPGQRHMEKETLPSPRAGEAAAPKSTLSTLVA